jgi:hypothetical protein
MICGCALVNLCLFQQNAWHGYAIQEPDQDMVQLVARYEPLCSWIPAGEATRFVMDEAHPTDADFYRRMFLTQYALSPRRVTRAATARWVVVDSACSDQAPEIARSAHCRLVADLHNGVRLYRTDAAGD